MDRAGPRNAFLAAGKDAEPALVLESTQDTASAQILPLANAWAVVSSSRRYRETRAVRAVCDVRAVLGATHCNALHPFAVG